MTITKRERKTWFWLQFPMIIVLQSTFQIIYIGMFSLFNGVNVPIDLTGQLFLIGELFSTIITIFIFVTYSHFFEKRSMLSLGLTNKSIISECLRGWILGSILTGIIGILVLVLTNSQFYLQQSLNFIMLLVYFLGFLFQGLSEEIIFRGYLMNGLVVKFTPLTAILLSSIIFSSVHVINGNNSVWSFINLMLLGVVLGLLFYKRQNIWVVGFLHGAWNFTLGIIFGGDISNISLKISILKMNVSDDHRYLLGNQFGLESSVVTTFILCASCASYYFIRQNTKSKK
ncbi:CPBP family intramembrane glutamic endopeptidase [Dellaglioa sp. L3N]